MYPFQVEFCGFTEGNGQENVVEGSSMYSPDPVHIEIISYLTLIDTIVDFQ